MHTLITIVHVIACVFMIMVVLLQSGRGGGMGAAFAGASGQIFGGRGASSFLSRATSVAAVVFFLTSLTLSMIDSRQSSVVRGMQPKPVKEGAANPNDAAGDETGTDKAEGKSADKKADTDAGAEKADDNVKAKEGDHAPEGANIAPAAHDEAAPGDAEKPGKPEALPPGAPEKQEN